MNMQYTTFITQKGQITIPIRKRLGITPNSKVTFKIKPIKSFFYLKGSIKSSKPFDIWAMDNAVKNSLTIKYIRKSN